MPKAFFECCKGTSIQRLGYLLDDVIGARAQSDALYDKWRENFTAANIKLSIASKGATFSHSRRWLVDVNEKLEVDDI